MHAWWKSWPEMEIQLCVAVDIDAEALFSVLCGGPAGDRCYHNCQAAQNSHSNRWLLWISWQKVAYISPYVCNILYWNVSALIIEQDQTMAWFNKKGSVGVGKSCNQFQLPQFRRQIVSALIYNCWHIFGCISWFSNKIGNHPILYSVVSHQIVYHETFCLFSETLSL